jgi:hypothetical protein
MTEPEPERWKIFNVSTFRRGCNTGTIKIISKSACSAFKTARKLLNENQQLDPQLISFRLLEVLPLTYKGPIKNVLHRNEVI